KLSIWLTGQNTAENWQKTNRNVDFFDAKALCVSVLQRVGIRIDKLRTGETDDDRFEYGMTYASNGQTLASVCKVDDTLLKRMDLEQDVYYTEINWKILEVLAGNVKIA